MSVIVLVGLVALPSLFTWFNVISSWDPFANTQKLTVAVANTDEGYQSDLVPLRVNVGEQVLSELRANHQLDWVITSEEDAIDGVRSEEYYAAIVLPPTLSRDMMTFYSGDSPRIGIDYYDNEKKNALSPKITDQGAGQLATRINKTFAATLGEAGMNIITSLSTYLDDADTQALLSRLQAHADSMAAQMRAGSDTATMFTSLIASSRPLVSGASDTALASGRAIGDAGEAIGGGVQAASSLKETLDAATTSLGAALATSTEAYPGLSAQTDEVLRSLDSGSATTAEALRTLAARVQTQTDQYRQVRDGLTRTVAPVAPEATRGAVDLVVSRLDAAIARQQALSEGLNSAATRVTDDAADVGNTRREVSGLIEQARAAVRGAEDAYSGNLKPKLDRLAATLSSVDDGISAIGADLSDATSTLSSDTDSLLATLDRAESTTASISDSLTDSARRFEEVSSALSRALDSGDLDALTRIIGPDPQVLAATLAAPVHLDRQPVYPVVSFGAAMAPFYTVLGLWVGALLIVVSIRDDVPEGALPGSASFTPTQAYLGRYGIVAVIGFLQSSLVSLGNIVFVGVQPAHPFLLIVAAWLTSLVFTLLIYSFVAAFGNAGKALGVLLLVIQISASGGSYPLPLLPQWFQDISSWLPATHAINATRAALAGIHSGDYWWDLVLLSLFLVPALLLGLGLRRSLMGYNRNLKQALESTKLM